MTCMKKVTTYISKSTNLVRIAVYKSYSRICMVEKVRSNRATVGKNEMRTVQKVHPYLLEVTKSCPKRYDLPLVAVVISIHLKS